MQEQLRKKAVFHIRVTQKNSQGEGETLEMATCGEVVFYEDGSRMLVYEESELSGLEGSTTSLKLEEGCITLSRSGAYSSGMRFETGRAFVSSYETPYGKLDLSVVAQQVAHRVTAQSGHVRLSYLLTIGTGESFDHALKIDIQYPEKNEA